MKEILMITINAVLCENFVLNKFMGICPFLGVSKKTKTAASMGIAVTLVIAISSAVTWLLNYFLLTKFNLEYLQTIVYILVIASMVQIIETILKKVMPPLYKALGIYLPLITTNCAVLGSTLIEAERYADNIGYSVWYGTCVGIGFTLAIILFSGVRERIEKNNIPQCFKGLPITLIAASILAVAFMGFNGLFSTI